MNKRKTMPSRDKIFNHWRNRIETAVNDNTCFKCGFTSHNYTAVERAHIKASCNGGDESVDNLHLLCSDCHKQSEHYEDNIYWFWFNDKSKNDYIFKMKLASHLVFGKISHPDLEDLKLQLKSYVKTDKDEKELMQYLNL